MLSQKLNSQIIIKRLAKGLIRLRLGAGWSEVLLLAQTTLLKKSGIPRVYVAHGLSRWRHGCSRNAPVSPRRHPGGDTVAPGVVPVYHGIWQPSRLLPVSPGCFKHFTTTGDVSRFNTVQHGSSRISKVVHGAATVVTRFTTVHPGSSNRDEPAP